MLCDVSLIIANIVVIYVLGFVVAVIKGLLYVLVVGCSWFSVFSMLGVIA